MPTMEHIVIVLVSSLLIVAHSDGTSAPGTYRTLFDYPADALGVNDLEGQEDASTAVTQKSSGVTSQLGGSDELDKLRRSIPGEPDVDYPIYRTPPETEFSCRSRFTGYYADVDTRCQVFRVCTNTDLTGKGFAFLCPNGTLFNQEVFVCDWYQHVDCSSSENHYGKNALLNMKIDSMSEMMKVVNEMVNFPLETNGERPIPMPTFPEFPRPVTQRQPAIPTTIPFVAQTTPTSNQFTLTPSSPPFGSRIANFNTTKATQPTPPTPQQRRPGFGTQTFTQEGDFEVNSKNTFDNTKTVQDNTYSKQPIFISSLGELSTDPGNKFDINTAKIIKPEDNQVITPPTLTKEQQLKESLSESFRNRANNNATNPGENNLANGLQRVLQQNPDYQVQVLSGEADLLQFIEQILHRNPDLTPDRLNAILSSESDAILQILNDAVNRNQSGDKSRENNILDRIQQILNKYKNNRGTVPILNGEADLLDSLKRILVRSQLPIFSGEADLVSFIELIVERNPEFTKQQLNAIISGETDSISSILNQNRQHNSRIPVKSGEAILLDAIENVLQQYRGRPQSVPTQTAAQRLQIQSGEGNLLENALRRIQQQSQIPIFSGEADLISFIEQIVQQNPDFTKQQLSAIVSGEADSISAIVNQKKQRNNGVPIESGEAILLEAIQIVLQKYRGQNITQPQSVSTSSQPVQQIVQSGEGNLLEGALRQIQQHSQIPVFSGEADLISFIEEIVQRNPDFTKEQLGAIISGEANSISTIVNQKRQQNIEVPVESGQAILLEAIEIVLQKYHGQPQTVPTQTQAQQIVQTGEGNLLEGALRRIQQQSQIPIFSGEANLISFIEEIVQKNPDFAKEQLGSIISDEADLISTIVNQKKQRNNGVSIESGEAILIEAIEIVLQKYRNKNTPSSVSPQFVPVQSGEGNLISSLKQIQQQSQIPIFSGEADLISFIELIVQRNPDFTKEQLAGIISGEANSISTILNEKRQRNNVIAVESGEAILLEAIQIVLQKYRANTGILNQIQPPYKTGSPLSQNQQGIVSITDINRLTLTGDNVVSQPTVGGGNSSNHSFFNQNLNGNGFKPVTSNEQGREISSQSPFNPISNNQNDQIESDELNLLEQTLEQLALRIPNQQRPIFSGEANRLAFIQQLKQHNPDLSINQLNAINGGEASSILRIFNEKTRKSKASGVVDGSADLLESIEIVLQKYRLDKQLLPPLREPIFTGESDLLESVQRIQQKSSVPINFGEADLLQFVRRIENQNPKYTPNQLSSIIDGGADSIIDILTENKQKENYSGFDVIESGEADLLVAIQYYVETYVKPDAVQPPTSFVANHPQLQYTQSSQAQTAAVNQLPQGINSTGQPSQQSVHGQLTAVSSGNSFYQYSNQNQGNTSGANGNATYSFEQNKQSQFSNQHSQSTQSHITKDVFRGQDNIYTQTAISHKTRSQSTSLNSQKIHYKFTQTVPYQQQQQETAAPVQFIQSSVSSTISPNTYIPPPVTPSSYSFASTQASKQVFTYPAVLNSEHEVRNLTLAHRDTDKRQRTLHAKDGSKEHHANAPDKRHADYTKDHQSTDLFWKGLHLSFFENNDLNQLDYYTTHERDDTPVRKRKSPLDFGNFLGTRNNNNNNQPTIDSAILTAHNETNDFYKRNNNKTETTKTGLSANTRSNDAFKNANIFKPTLTFDKAVLTNATHEPRTLNNYTEPFLIRVY
ncbi:uncharacterized protein LOC129567310 isoform X2 [Sitodiplosis mosellana]|uniref:uncharacterized protein LOC129567310 isoform X2 n=1 Tax=Sitodiplosis mosellana TaxID=263140 RepID=UPI0024450AC3|nr:uncharacterized protein LOC129567310 isoform X2 [Sitodiplosis mosellana]